ncbi:ATP-binding protein [Aquibacillus kalidii]|uniref:ATP-binding protein n=1 Tax=Aquibacillus kalidii TaxID=2762597 RepID=UPI001C99C6B2|nr:ATP-binding protein [Aquibacillus kalidii]
MREENIVMLNEKIEESNVHHNSLSTGGHILYIYNDREKYIENATNFIFEGLINNEGVIYVDHKVYIDQIIDKLKDKSVSETEIQNISFVESDLFYRSGFPMEKSLEELASLADPYLEKGKVLRVWGNVRIQEVSQVLSYEQKADKFIRNLQIYTVCAYDGNLISASLVIEMLNSHPYFMTDSFLIPSYLYNHDESDSPSISNQINLEKEADNFMMRSEQLSFAGQFAAGICHEIRNPLTTIKGFFQLLKDDNHNTKYYKVIENELNRIQQITSELLLLAKPHSEQREVHNLVNIVNEVVVLLESQAVMKSILIEKMFMSQDLNIVCDDTKVKQVIINMVKNAIEVMNGGRITIKAAKVSNNVILMITDEGPGIPKEQLHKIGEPFYTTKKDGTGLGLIISFNIIKSHGGTVKIHSEEGKGTTFEIILPTVN